MNYHFNFPNNPTIFQNSFPNIFTKKIIFSNSFVLDNSRFFPLKHSIISILHFHFFQFFFKFLKVFFKNLQEKSFSLFHKCFLTHNNFEILTSFSLISRSGSIFWTKLSFFYQNCVQKLQKSKTPSKALKNFPKFTENLYPQNPCTSLFPSIFHPFTLNILTFTLIYFYLLHIRSKKFFSFSKKFPQSFRVFPWEKFQFLFEKWNLPQIPFFFSFCRIQFIKLPK